MKMIVAILRFSAFILCAMIILFSVAIWMRGMRVGDRVVWFRMGADSFAGTDVNIWSARGGVGIYVTHMDYGSMPPDFGPVWLDDAMVVYPYIPNPQLHKGLVQLAGFAWLAENGKGWHERTFIFPWAAPLVLFGAPMIWMVRGWRRRRRIKRRLAAGLCVRCGYDLRHSPSICPECGAHVRITPPVATRG